MVKVLNVCIDRNRGPLLMYELVDFPVYYPLRDSVDFLTTRLDALQQEMVMIQRQLDSQAEPLPLVDRRTRPSIGNLLKEDVYQEPKDISETSYARLEMQQRSIGNLQHRSMQVRLLEKD
ncbi:hypothetical protein F2Q68_00010048 [Brassica cretica]|uniref:Uncharacterized protein n=1 Tax=Brassica cretica TaxID=69181 RepID=A0A3N6PVC4_BRACR|nr:hypothetical protein F2Q68_00010048 [Brassica cretica]